MNKYHIITYGCQMNKSDSERIATILESKNYQPASNENEADLIVVNMCSVRQSAVDRVYGLIPKFQKLKIQNSNLKTILTGCVLKKDKKKFKKGFDLILDIKDLPNWPKYLGIKNYELRIRNYLNVLPKYQNDFLAFIPISNGCNNFCAYCVVPFVRGSLACRSHKEILKEVENAIKNGVKEIWLLGQNVNSYQSPIVPSVDFSKLLRQVNNIPGDFWIRFTSPHPKDFSDELIITMAECKKVTEYLNLPVQSGDDEILKKMNRPYTIKQYKTLIKKIREKIYDIALSTDVIVGFPGETKKQFQNTIKLFKKIKFDMAYIAKYSPRPETTAAKMKDTVSPQEKEKREKVLTEVLKQTALENNKKYIGKTVEVLAKKSKNGFFIGKTRTCKTIKFEAPGREISLRNEEPKNLIGQFIQVKVINVMPWGLTGKFMGIPSRRISTKVFFQKTLKLQGKSKFLYWA
ncbi:MAG: tRNA (N6-isopentenyl adenosine(37)-C2)-methylthiotransferase MiaB [Candidatus Nealsonbacteria bacterium CG_4_8_14_3_um_filter_37_23]|nr:MAG: tRNA (N6-isopentenyl adenosine(37)-C2)-methylthiotransferase MiaB [Candidatus Nealsonbacteria bacterium CG_4_8_14_3_um_filter_37_23]